MYRNFRITNLHRSLWIPVRNSYMRRDDLYKRCYEILGIPENSDQNSVRSAYLRLVKKVHPDSGCPEASRERFLEVDEAFRVLQKKYAKARRNIDDDLSSEVKVYDIKHTVPQHRQFLSYDGYGVGTIFQREKQYQKKRVFVAQERVMEHRMSKAQATENAVIKKGGDHFKRHAIKTKYGFDRVVEDLIQEAMSKGDFKNLSGTGKPLSNQNDNPHVDFVTHKLNKILIDNGFVPEWITLQKEIREDVKNLKDLLSQDRAKIGKLPLEPKEENFWEKRLEKYEYNVKQINKSIDKYNLIVPRACMDKQMVHISLTRIAEKILQEGITNVDRGDDCNNQKSDTADYNKPTLFGLFGQFFN